MSSQQNLALVSGASRSNNAGIFAVASIAHEVNQPLAAIVANSQACRRWLSADPPNLDRGRTTLERIIRDAHAAAELVSRIDGLFSRGGIRARTSVDINQVIDAVWQSMADEIATKNIRVAFELDPDLPPARADRIQIQQVLTNLIRNALDALDTVADDARSVQIRSLCDAAGTIRVEVRDNGIGLTEFEQIFEPFFTTKTHGMGMGLAICRSIIESHDGRLWASPNKPGGTTFVFTLPVHASDAEALRASHEVK
ncbi:sensor histidine kinase [Reyranella sp. CPCC 100927]|uniref:sensor histidine kinase n=1 Tax=Reyranella sp. CPCC 100927 TaxID=2599616 RepID=UPI0011B597C0|nr:sensor histidine kinase [Reyranella sp. CPCC 100927]TWT02607.1 GHKL domain-containing protein [Reyranella sp. CPCC 100927]